VHCPWITTRRLRVWVCWQSLQVEYTGSFLVFNTARLLASACPTRAIPMTIDGSIILKQIERKKYVWVWNGLIWE
jgi:hypothetical protein